MRLIPVIDLIDGQAVHAIRGERERYRPVESRLADGGDALALLGSFRRLGLQELYLADLDAIRGVGQNDALIARLVRQRGVIAMVDAGATTLDRAYEVLALGAQKVIVASETLDGWRSLAAIRAGLPGDRLVFSLDLLDGRVIARHPDLAGLDPLVVLDRLQGLQVREVIVLDLAHVGASTGGDCALLSAAHAACPSLCLLTGGGIRHLPDLQAVQHAGGCGALLATALHDGSLEPAAIREMLAA